MTGPEQPAKELGVFCALWESVQLYAFSRKTQPFIYKFCPSMAHDLRAKGEAAD